MNKPVRTLARLAAATAVVGVGATAALAAEKWDMPMAYSATNFHSHTGAAVCQMCHHRHWRRHRNCHPSVRLAVQGRGDQTRHPDRVRRRLVSGCFPDIRTRNALFGFDSVPFLATSFDDSAKLWKAAKPALEKLLDSQNLVLLYAVPWPPQGFYFKKEVDSVADMEGIKFRSYNTATARLAELTGMLPVQIEAAEISQAFATGVAESMVSSGSTGYDRKVWESLTHFYEVDAWLPRNYVLINKDVWNGVSDANKNIINACAGMAEYAGNWRSKEYTGFTLQGLRDGGMTVGPASEGLVNELKEIGVTMTNEWLEKAGAEGKDHRRRIQEHEIGVKGGLRDHQPPGASPMQRLLSLGVFAGAAPYLGGG